MIAHSADVAINRKDSGVYYVVNDLFTVKHANIFTYREMCANILCIII